MSLDFKVGKIEDFLSVVYDGEGNMKPVTQSLIWATMSVDLGEITEANAAEFWARVNLFQKYVGPWYNMPKGPVVVTAEDVVAHIGLTTNVINRTRHQWFARMISSMMNDDVSTVGKLLAKEPV